MEQFTPIILLILWLIVSFLNNRKKQATPPARPVARPETTSRPQETDLEEMLKDVFGKKEEPTQEARPVVAEKPKAPEFFEPVAEMQEDSFPQRTYKERELTSIEQAFEQSGQDYQSFETAETILPEATFEQHEGLETLENEYQFFADSTNLASLEDAQAILDKAREMPAEEMELIQEEFEQLPFREFNAQDAVVFSEIINRKYS